MQKVREPSYINNLRYRTSKHKVSLVVSCFVIAMTLISLNQAVTAQTIILQSSGTIEQTQSIVSPTPTPMPTPTPTQIPTSNQITISSSTASSYDAQYPPSLAIDGIESTSNYWGTNALITAGQLPQWLRLDLGTQNTIKQITTHFYDGDSRTYTYNIQASTDASTWTTVVASKTGSGVVTDTFNQVTARYVKITITGNTAWNAGHIEEIKIYQTTTQTSTPTPTPSPTQTPTSQNLEPLSAFLSDVNGAASSYASLDYSVTHNGNPSIRIGTDSSGSHGGSTREIDGAWINVKPGDHIYYAIWAKTAAYDNWNAPYNGIRMGFDAYVTSYVPELGRTCTGVSRPNAGHPSDAENGLPYNQKHWQIPWGTDWTLLYWDITMPTTQVTSLEQDGRDYACNPAYISQIVAIVDAREVEDNAYAWFSEPVLYINP